MLAVCPCRCLLLCQSVAQLLCGCPVSRKLSALWSVAVVRFWLLWSEVDLTVVSHLKAAQRLVAREGL